MFMWKNVGVNSSKIRIGGFVILDDKSLNKDSRVWKLLLTAILYYFG